MINVIYEDLRCVVFCGLIGFLLAALYDFFRIVYKLNKSGKNRRHHRYLQYLGDIIFFVCSALAVFQIMLDKYNGRVRGYALFFMGFGAFIHRKIICDTFVNSICKMIFYIDSKIVLKIKRLFVENIKKLRLVKSTRSILLKIYHRCSKMFVRPNSNRESDDFYKDVTK